MHVYTHKRIDTITVKKCRTTQCSSRTQCSLRTMIFTYTMFTQLFFIFRRRGRRISFGQLRLYLGYICRPCMGSRRATVGLTYCTSNVWPSPSRLSLSSKDVQNSGTIDVMGSSFEPCSVAPIRWNIFLSRLIPTAPFGRGCSNRLRSN